MSVNPKRLPLLLDIGLMAARAFVQERLDQQVLPGEAKPDPHAPDHWYSVLNKLEDLARMDHEDNYTPNSEPILSGAGILVAYQIYRHWHEISAFK